MIDFLTTFLGYRFFVHALLAAALASISCGLAGTYIVTRRMVFISGSISHASFGGIGMGYFLAVNPIFGAAVFAVLSALGIRFFSRSAGVREDSATGIFWSFGMAAGIIFVYLTPGYAPNLMSYLFGSILTITPTDLVFLSAITLVLALVFLLLFRFVVYTSFDEEYARTHKLRVSALQYLMISLVALTIVACVRIAGIILVISLLTLPQTTANQVYKSYQNIIWLSVLVSFLGITGGILISYFFDIPSGATIIFLLLVIYIIVRLTREIIIRVKLHKSGILG